MDDNGARLVIADDTDVFVMLLPFKLAGFLGDVPIYMESPLYQRGVIDIDATVENNHSIIPDLLVAHALSGCYTVASYYGSAWLACQKKTVNRSPIAGGGGFDTICTAVCIRCDSCTACRLCRLETQERISDSLLSQQIHL